jgi:hypothetical protein
VASIASIHRSTTYERRVGISLDGDRRQENTIATVLRNGFSFDWDAILSELSDAPDPLAVIERFITRELQSATFHDTVDMLTLSGQLIAAYIQQRHEEEIGIQSKPAPLSFAEAAAIPATPESVLQKWQRILGLTDEELDAYLAGLRERQNARAVMAARIRDAMTERVQNLFSKYPLTGADINRGDQLQDFVKNAREIMPDASNAVLETEYRTRLTEEYGTKRHEQIVQRANVFPFIQYMALLDGRTTWWICLPMGTAGPNGRGYVAASDDPHWFKWRTPNHFRCRADTSPISYREAQRMGILAADGRTKIALIGSNPNRPYGDPPRFATDPDTGKLRAVEPQEGFGA